MNDRRQAALGGVGRLLLAPGGEGVTDAHLLGLYLTARDGAAFEALVRRHGPMVLGVCRRAAGHEQDAEDAFQATFLVLARRAADVRPADRVGCWLYGVAYRTARKARANARRRRARERPIGAIPDPPAPPAAGSDLAQVLDAEMSRLPDLYRVPLVLCDLEGRPRRDVARMLGIPEGTLSSRLTAARQRLADRLTRRGVSGAAAVLGGALGGGAGAVPPALLAAASSLGAAGAVVPGTVAALTAAGRATAGGWLAAVGLAAGVAVLVAAGRFAPARGPQPPPPDPAGTIPAPPAGIPAQVERAGWLLTAVAADGRAVDLCDRAGGRDVVAVLRGPGGPVVSGLSLRDLAVEPGAAVEVDGRGATPADLRPGMWVRVRLTPGRLAAARVEARSVPPPEAPPPTRCVVTAIDPARGVMEVEVSATGVRVGGLRVTPATKVEVFRFGNEPHVVTTAAGGLVDIRAGAAVDLDLDLNETGRFTVRRVRTAR